MLRVEVARAKPGMKLALPVRHPRQFDQVLLRVGYPLEPSTIDRLMGLAIRVIWVQYPQLDFLDKFIDEEVTRTQSDVVNQVSKAFETAQKDAASKLPIDSYVKAIGGLITSLVANPQAAVFMGDLASAGGEDLMRHSSTVTYLALLMGLRLEGYLVRQRKHIDPHRAKEVTNLGIGGMLHDIGVPHLDPDVRARYYMTGNESDPAWQEHPRLGYELVRGKVAPSAATVVLNHHQRFDGSGWAGKGAPILSEQRIHVFARIVGLADYFDRLRYPANLPAQPVAFVLGSLLEPTVLRKFDLEVVRALFAVVPPYAPGSLVQLSDQRWAAVVDHNVQDPCRPVVQIMPEPTKLNPEITAEGKTIDLSEESPLLHIAMADGIDVSGLNFSRPDILQTDPAFAW